MDVVLAAKNMRVLIRKHYLNTNVKIDSCMAEARQDETGKGLRHMFWMLDEIALGKITDDKAHRWLGYVQGMCVAEGILSLEACKISNVLA